MATDTSPNWDADLQVYEPHRAGLPKFGPYFKQLTQRLQFAAEFSKSGIKAAHSQTVFGQMWLVLNPLLLALVYYVLVNIIGGRSGMEFLAHIVGGLFVFFFFSGAISTGAGSVVGGGKLIMNMAFPRLLMPLASVRTAFFRFLPTVPVFLIINGIAGAPWSPVMFLGLVFLFFTVVFAFGMAAVLATLQVYFRDTSSFLPYFVRIWLYLSPVLWTLEDAKERFPDTIMNLMVLNPLFPLIGGWTELVIYGQVPEPRIWIAALVWAVISAVAGSLFFMSRERDFAVRL